MRKIYVLQLVLRYVKVNDPVYWRKQAYHLSLMPSS
jgi:hypothetical protein